MKKQKPFVSNYLFDKSLTKEQVESLFDFGLDMIQWHKSALEKKDWPRSIQDAAHLNHLIFAAKQMLEFKNASKIKEVEDGILLSFPINYEDEKFSEKNESKCRIWLRAHIDDYFIKYVRTGISFKMMEVVAETRKEPPKEMEDICNAFENALSKAYEKKSKGFWITGE